ncbi:MAG: class I SAM-dependent methyltransferase [Candidatus Zixiibacteriota bacterium]
MKDEHQQFFDKLAAEWDLLFTAEDLERLQHIVDKIDMRESWNILDLGCGTGVLFDMLRRRVGPTGTVTGVDLSLQMAVKAHRNFPFANVNVVDANAIDLPFPDGTYDMAIAFASFPHFSDQQRAINETHRVLKPGANFHIIHLESSREVAATHHQIGGPLEHDELPTEERLKQMLDSSRFSNVQIEDHPGLFLASAVNSR